MELDFSNCTVEFKNIRGGKVPDNEYFKMPGISNSRLKYIDPLEGGSPQLFRDGVPFTYNSSLTMGSAIHSQLLSEDEYDISEYEGKPSAKLGYFIDCVYEFRHQGKTIAQSIELASQKAEYWAGKLTKNRIQKAIKEGLDYYLRKVNGEFTSPGKEVFVLPKAQLDSCKRAIRSLKNEPKLKQLFADNMFIPKQFLNEFAFFVDIDVTLSTGDKITIPFKGKADNIIIDPETKTIYLNDIKTTSKPVECFMGGLYEGVWYDGSFEKLHYMRQFTCYLMMLQMYVEQVLGLTDYNYKCNVFVVETTGNNRAKTYPVNNSFIQYGAKEFKELICRVAFHEIYGYDKEIESVDY